MITDTQRLRRVEGAQVRALFNAPFYGGAICRLPAEFADDEVETACTAGSSIRWGRAWMDKLPDKVLPTVLVHEASHCLFGHLWRAPADVDWETWNIACDHEVNLGLAEWSAKALGDGRADPFPFPEPKEAFCADPRFAGMACEVIYGILSREKQQGGGGGKGKPGQGQGVGKPDPHSMPAFGQMAQRGQDKASQAAAEACKKQWQAALQGAIAAGKAVGTLPGSLARYAKKLLHPEPDGWEVVRNWLRERSADDWTWSKPNQYFDDSGLMLPVLESERMGPVVFATDTSGSVDVELLSKFRARKQDCLDELRPERLLDVCCDTMITLEREYAPGEEIGGEAPGGGGTSFAPVFERVEGLPWRPKCLVYLTDLRGRFPAAEPGYPVVWLVWGGCKTRPPFGEVIHVG
jgi:predicted metal-dependent peptidase